SEDPKQRMPAAESNKTLTAAEKATLVRWIEHGSEYKPHWAFIKPVKQAGVTGIDELVLARLKREGIKPAPPADRESPLNRVTFDLTGLPPTPTEMKAFL